MQTFPGVAAVKVFAEDGRPAAVADSDGAGWVAAYPDPAIEVCGRTGSPVMVI